MAGKPGYYITSIDRVGLAFGAGALACGVTAVLLVAIGGQRDPAMLVGAVAIGTVFGAIAIVVVAGPVWIALHVAGRRGPVAAMLAGTVIGLILFVAGQNWSAPEGPIDAAVTGGLVALAAAAIGWTMHRIAYHRLL